MPSKKKKSNLKRLAWTQISRHQTSGTVFQLLDADSVEFDDAELLALFGRAQAKEAAERRKQQSQERAASGKISLLALR